MKGNVVNSRKHQTSHLCICEKNLLSYETYAKVKRPNLDRMENVEHGCQFRVSTASLIWSEKNLHILSFSSWH